MVIDSADGMGFGISFAFLSFFLTCADEAGRCGFGMMMLYALLGVVLHYWDDLHAAFSEVFCVVENPTMFTEFYLL